LSIVIVVAADVSRILCLFFLIQMVAVTGAVCYEQEACGMWHKTQGIVVPSFVSDPVVSIADKIVDDDVYYLLHASVVRLLLLLLLLL